MKKYSGIKNLVIYTATLTMLNFTSCNWDPVSGRILPLTAPWGWISKAWGYNNQLWGQWKSLSWQPWTHPSLGPGFLWNGGIFNGYPSFIFLPNNYYPTSRLEFTRDDCFEDQRTHERFYVRPLNPR